jgi:hypothetical protein
MPGEQALTLISGARSDAYSVSLDDVGFCAPRKLLVRLETDEIAAKLQEKNE